VGPGAPPIKTPRGWLNIYHATTATMAGQITVWAVPSMI